MIEALDASFATQTMTALGTRLRAANLVWAPVQTPADLVSDLQAHAAGCFNGGIDATGATFEMIAPPVDFGEECCASRCLANMAASSALRCSATVNGRSATLLSIEHLTQAP
ncbi:hypothetical protein G4G27_21845 [Sphingomonas sp. So64.6b]|uniref:CoA transferase n=1 Tax=Sphingomonas sp. So64.6b TaxID=2997354 RepID=UPI0016016D19|nr:CoA transferase [Sphingomonas sp. So64.6b]QNA82571.1 hypothetical protein G4G27_21845 [Sphingomonas sp. So64.6b]